MSLPEAISLLCASWARKRRAEPALLNSLQSLLLQNPINGASGNDDGPALPVGISFFDSLLRLFDDAGDKVERWLVYMIAAQVLPMNREGVEAILSSGLAQRAASQWAGRGRQLTKNRA